MVPSGGSHFRFGTFEADPASGEFWKNGRRIRLQEQPFRLLVLLLENAGSVVTREELQRCLWPADTFVEFDYGLNTAIKKLRQALGDSADNPRFIQTLPRKGYRFIAPVSGAEAAAPVAPSPPWRWRMVLAAVCLVAAAAMSVWLLRPRRVPPAVPVPFISYHGEVGAPSFSPDGRSVAFAWNGENEDNLDIYVKQIGTETPVRLTTDPARDFGPAWSPNARLIAFGRTLNDTRTDILILPAAGGPEVKVTETVTPYSTRPLLAWSPDSKWLVITDTDSTKTSQFPEFRQEGPGFSRRSLFLVSTETRERRRLTSQPDRPAVDAAPAFSPDGRTLAFVRSVTLYVGNLYLLPLSRAWAPAGVPKRLTAENQSGTSPAWTPDGASIVFASGGLRIAARGNGEVRRLEFAGNNASFVAISRQGNLVYSQTRSRAHIWRVALSGAGVIGGAPKQFLASNRSELNPQFSAEGKRIVFASTRGGSPELWIANADGTNPAALTSMHASWTGGPNWSPDGSHIAFDSEQGGQYEVYSIGAAGGTPRRLTNNPAVDGVPSWSRDGAWIYFMSDRSRDPQVWKMPAAGGQPVQVTNKGGYVAVESPDGRFVYYSKSSTDDTGLWKVPVGGGEETEVLPSVTHMNFAVAKDGIYFIPKADAQGRYAVQFFSFATGKTRPVAGLSGRYTNGLAVSPDGKILLYSQLDTPSIDWMMVDNFR
jgi:Tol biopolymer transport system component/DNA-binding winged helix-turn-helix (wHTH) protein